MSSRRLQTEADEPAFRLRPRKPRRTRDESKTWSQSFQGLMRLVRMTTRRIRRPSGNALPARLGHRQRCAVRLTYSPNRVSGQWAAHGRYLARESAAGASVPTARGFDRRGQPVELSKALAEWQQAGDARLFKIIVSPEFGERADLPKLTHGFMQSVEDELGRTLEWVAVAHYNTEHPHVHIALRGVADGQPLRLERDFVKHGLRQLAEDQCTVQMGFRTKADAQEAERREVRQIGVTSLDRRIQRVMGSHSQQGMQLGGGRIGQLVSARLHVLKKLGLAQEQANGWSVESGFLSILREMQRTTDRQRMLAAYAHLLTNPALPIQYTRPGEVNSLSGHVIANVIDDSNASLTLVLEAADAVRFIPFDEGLAKNHLAGLLQTGSTVLLERRNGSLAVKKMRKPLDNEIRMTASR